MMDRRLGREGGCGGGEGAEAVEMKPPPTSGRKITAKAKDQKADVEEIVVERRVRLLGMRADMGAD
jgi:hypothetical protein